MPSTVTFFGFFISNRDKNRDPKRLKPFHLGGNSRPYKPAGGGPGHRAPKPSQNQDVPTRGEYGEKIPTAT